MLLRELQFCLDACLQCIQDCERVLAEGGGHPDFAACQRLCRDCADICQLCAYLILRKSAIHARSYTICADICRRCALACERVSHSLFQICADSCHHCADLCEDLALADAA